MAQRTVPANELAIKALRCPEGKARIVYHVDGHGNEGLKLYIERSGTKTWYYRARVAGSATKDMPLGRWPDVTISEARKRKTAAVSSISNGEDPWRKRAEERGRKSGTTLDEVFGDWLETVAGDKRTCDQDELRYSMNIKGGHLFVLGKWKGRTHKTGIGHIPIDEITRLHVSTCLSDVRKRSASQAHHALVLLNTLFKWARSMGYIDVNPAEGQPFYRRSRPRERYLNELEIAKFWHGLEADPHLMPTTRICLRLLLLTGARRDDWAEAAKAELQEGCLVVPAERYKGKRVHRIPLCPMAQEQVSAALRLAHSSPWLFPTLGAFGARSTLGRMNAATITESMGRLMARLGIPHATPHTLRHTVGSHLDRMGYALEEIGLALGHKPKGTTAGYVHDLDGRRAAQRRRPILEAWERELRRIVDLGA
jgi:integrase